MHRSYPRLDCPVVKGNHDEQATFPASSERFNELAERAIEWTRERLNEQDREWLRSLPLQRQVHDFTIVHATLDTPGQWGYVFNNLDAVASFTYQRTAVCFFGHTHVPMVFVRDEGVRREARRAHSYRAGKKYFINAGSVGQPRDGNWRAGILHLRHGEQPGRTIASKIRSRHRAEENHESRFAAAVIRTSWQWDAEETTSAAQSASLPVRRRYKVTIKNRTQRLPALPSILRSLAENKVCNRQIARVSDFEIKIVVENESDLLAESLDC